MARSPHSVPVSPYSFIVESEPHTGSGSVTAGSPVVTVHATPIQIQGVFPDAVSVRAISFSRTDTSSGFDSHAVAAAQPERVALPGDLAAAAPRRVATFIAGRHCAIHAMGLLGVEAPSVIRGQIGAPKWPEGVVGSIAHTDDMAIAAVARSHAAQSLGVDCERIMTPETAGNVRGAVAAELVAGHDNVRWGGLSDEARVTCVFCAKETLYKCLNPRAGVFFGFDDASVVCGDIGEGVLKLRLNRTLAGDFTEGSTYAVRIVRHGGHFVAGMLLPP